MANEAVIIELLGADKGMPIRYDVSDATKITKGCLMHLSGDHTAIASSGSADIFAGIAAADKTANDGATTLALYTEGIFDLTLDASNTIALGNNVKISGANFIVPCLEADMVLGKNVGVALEAGSVSETIRVHVGRV